MPLTALFIRTSADFCTTYQKRPQSLTAGAFPVSLSTVADGCRYFCRSVRHHADGLLEIVCVDLAEHADRAEGIADLARRIADGRGDRAQAGLILAILYGVALLTDALKLRCELLRLCERIRRIGPQLRLAQDAAALRLRHGRKE